MKYESPRYGIITWDPIRAENKKLKLSVRNPFEVRQKSIPFVIQTAKALYLSASFLFTVIYVYNKVKCKLFIVIIHGNVSDICLKL